MKIKTEIFYSYKNWNLVQITDMQKLQDVENELKEVYNDQKLLDKIVEKAIKMDIIKIEWMDTWNKNNWTCDLSEAEEEYKKRQWENFNK